MGPGRIQGQYSEAPDLSLFLANIYLSFILSSHKACISHLRLKMKKKAAKPIYADDEARKSSRGNTWDD